ncbi:MAG: porin [Kofleriaceae bacterium]
MRRSLLALSIAAAAEALVPQVARAQGNPDPVQDAGVAGYDDGFFLTSRDGRFLVRITSRVQVFYDWERTASGGPDDASYQTQFEIRRARLVLEGHAWTRRLRYLFQTDFGQGEVVLKDYRFDVELADDAWLRVGQWKRPYSRQYITSSGRLELPDRAITNAAFGTGRDIGIALANEYEHSPDIEWTIGLFNGFDADSPQLVDGTFTNVPPEFRPALIGRIGINRHGIRGYREGDLEGGPLRWAAAASVWLEADFAHDDQAAQRAEIDYILKVHGFSSTGALYLMSAQDGPRFTDQTPAKIGFHVQAGYMVTRQLEAAARYALIEVAPGQGTDQQEITIGGTYYAFGHDAKVAAAVRFLRNGSAGFADDVTIEIGTNVGF